jgi:hypothetical protein
VKEYSRLRFVPYDALDKLSQAKAMGLAAPFATEQVKNNAGELVDGQVLVALGNILTTVDASGHIES